MTTAITIYPDSSNPSPYQAGKTKAPDIVNDDFFGSFKDLFNIINPLQHLPGISTAYQALTGDKPSTGAQIAGGVLFGGVLGLVGSLANAIIAQETGKDIGENLYAVVTGKYQQTEALS